MEGLIRVKGLRVPNDLDGGYEEQCNKRDVWELPPHTLPNGEPCVGSRGLLYNSDVTEGHNGWTGNCRVCGQ